MMPVKNGSERVVTCQNVKIIGVITFCKTHVPAPDKTFSDDPGKENERRRKLEELENRAPSPLILTHTSSLVGS